MMTVSSRGAAALPALSLVLLAMSASSPSATAQRFDLSQLSLRAAAEAQAGSSGYFNCPEQVREQNNVWMSVEFLEGTSLSNASPNARDWIRKFIPIQATFPEFIFLNENDAEKGVVELPPLPCMRYKY